MRRMGMVTALVGAMLMGGAAVHAAEQMAAAPSPEAQRLKVFEGNWKVSGETTMGGQTSKISGEAKCQEGASGFAMTCNMKLKGMPNMKEYDEVGIFAYDPETKSVHYYSSSNAGETHDHSGTWTDKNTLQLQSSTMAGGKPAQEQMQIVQKSAKEIEVMNPVTSSGRQIGVTHFIFKK